MLKKFIAKRAVKKVTGLVLKKEAKVLVGVLLTIGTHKLIQKGAIRYPALRFLKMSRSA
jgi:hypothetical protein